VTVVTVADAGLVTQLPEDFYGFMLELQGKLAKMIKSVGKIEHALYPLSNSYCNKTRMTIIWVSFTTKRKNGSNQKMKDLINYSC